MKRDKLKSEGKKNATPFKLSSILDTIEHKIQKNSKWILGILILIWIISRISIFTSVEHTPLQVMYNWANSDNRFFNEWALKITAGDYIGQEPYHPYHSWHKEFAEYYLAKHPEKELEILSKFPQRDSSFIPGVKLWDEWYGGNTFHQEPFYPYLLALLYKLTGDGIYWMLALQCLFGIFSGILIWRISKFYFGNTAALIAGIIYSLCGIIIFQEVILLRTSWIVFFTLLNVYIIELAFRKNEWNYFLLSGTTLGLAYLVQSTFSLLLIFMFFIYLILHRKSISNVLKLCSITLVGFILMFSPVMIRNFMVGAPLTSISSTAAITFLATNVKDSKSIYSWFPEKEKCAEIMGKNNGRLIPVAMDAIGSHNSLISYIELLGKKITAMFIGVEFSSNENYYFYKLHVLILSATPIMFDFLFAIGMTGLIFSIINSKKCWIAYAGIFMQVALLIGFYTIGRLRTPLAALLIPFVAYTFLECVSIFNNRKIGILKIIILIFMSYFFYFRQSSKKTHLRSVDYDVLYDNYYRIRMDSSSANQDHLGASKLHLEFMRNYEPQFVKELNTSKRLVFKSDVELVKYFARHYEIQYQICDLLKDTECVKRYKFRSDELKSIVNNSISIAK